jgi:gliding motility-associated-like protein
MIKPNSFLKSKSGEKFKILYLFFLLFLCYFNSYAQYLGGNGSGYTMANEGLPPGNLTVVSTGGDIQGSTTWNYNNGLITINGNTVTINASDILTYINSGPLTISANSINFGASFTSSSTNSISLIAVGNITINNPISTSGPIQISGTTITINNSLTATNSAITLAASTGITQTNAIVANDLILQGSGIFTLDNINNNVVNISGGSSARLGSLSFVDATGGLIINELTLGSTGSNGVLRIETLDGDITIGQSITTTSTASEAILINAGKNDAIGIATSGNILISGTPLITTGSGGIMKLLSGDESHSIGLTALVGGISNTRANVDETSSSITPSLIPGQIYALYRTSTAPLAPINLVATPGNAQVSIVFTSGSNGGSTITGYEYSLNDSTWIAAAQTSSPITITGLTNGTSYSIKLRAKNVIGNGAISDAVSVTPVSTPSAPTNLIATPGNTQVSIAFTSGSNGGSAITGYEYSLNNGTWIAASQTSSPITITGLTNGTIYEIKLRAINLIGNGAESTAINIMSVNPSLTLSNNSIPTLSNCKTPRVIPNHGASSDITITASDIVNIRVPNPFTQPPLNNPYLVYQNGTDWKYYLTPLYTSGNSFITSTNAITLNELMIAYPGVKAESDNLGTTAPTSFDQVTGVAASANTVLPYYESFTVSGIDLQSNVTITPPVNFQVATNPTTWIGSSSIITLTPTSGTIASTTIYVRPVPGIAAGSYSGNITVATGSLNSTKSVSATISAPIAFTSQPVSAVSVCQNANYTLTALATGTGLTYQWFSNTTNSTIGGTSLGTANGAQTASLVINTATSGTTYYYVIASGTCGSVASSVTTLIVNEPSVAGTSIAASSAVCPNTATTINLSSYTGNSIQWQQSANGTSNWVNVSGGSGSTTDSYTTAQLIAPTYFRAVVSNGSCASAISSTIPVTIHALSVAGTATVSSANLTSGASTTLSLTGQIGAIQWQQSLDGVVWNNVSGGTGTNTSSYTTPALSVSTYFRAEVNNASCATVYSNAVLVTLPNNVDLASLSVITGTLSPVFNSSIQNYAVLLSAGATSFTFTPSLSDVTGRITINDVIHTNGTPFTTSLNGQSRALSIKITSADRLTIKEYKLNVMSPPTTNALSVAPVTVTEGDSYVQFIVTGTSGQNISFQLADMSANGAGLDFGALPAVTTVGQSNLETSVDFGVTWNRFNNFIALPASQLLWVRTPLIDDEIVEPEERFKLIAYPVTQNFDGKQIYSLGNLPVPLDFSCGCFNPTVGTVFRANRSSISDGTLIQVRAKILAMSNVSSFNPDASTTFPNGFFKPVFKSTNAAGGYVDWEIKFYRVTGPGINDVVEIAVKDFLLSGIDVSSNKYVEINNFTSYELSSNTKMTVSNPRAGFTRFTSGNSYSFSMSPNYLEYVFYANFPNPVSSFIVRTGITGLSSTTKMFGLKIDNRKRFNSVSTGTATTASAEHTILDNEPIQLRISAPVLTKTKSYSGTTTAAVIKGAVIGIKTGHDVTVTAVATYDNALAGTGKKITVVYSVSGANSANYIAPEPYEVTDGEITPLNLVISPTVGLTKVYGTADPDLTYSFLGNLPNETPLFSGALSRTSGNNVGSYAIVRGTLAINNNGDFKVNNYNLVIASNSTMTITKAPLIVKVLDDSKFVTKSDVSGYSGVSYQGFVYGETKSVINETNLVIQRTNVGEEVAGLYTGVLQAIGLQSANYSFTYQSGNYTIVAADQLQVKIQPVERAYGTVISYQVASAQYLSSTNNTVVDLIQNVTINNSKVTIIDGSGGSAIFDIIPLQPQYSSSSRIKVGSYTLGATNIVVTSSNFNNSVVVQGSLQIKPTIVSIEANGGISKVYDGNADMINLTLQPTSAFAGDIVAVTGIGSFTSKNAGSQNYEIKTIALTGNDSDNYFVLGGASAVLIGNNGSITKRNLVISPTPNQKKEFGATNPNLTYSYNGNLSAEVPIFNGVLSRNSGENVGEYAITIGTLGITDQSNFIANNYLVVLTSGVLFSITKKDISTINLNIATPVSVVYDGQNQLPEPQVDYNSNSLVKGTDFIYSYKNNKSAGTATVTITGIGNYSGAATVDFQILPKVISVTAIENTTKEYGEVDPVFAYTFSGAVSGEIPAFEGSLGRVIGEDVGTYNYSIGNLNLIDTATFKSSNYALELINEKNLTITKAPLVVSVNKDSKLVTQLDVAGYAGVSLSGFKFGETRTDLDDTNFTILRTNSSVQNAGVYSNVLVASGFVSNNYSFTYLPADYTIIGADQLVVKIADVQTVYGNVPSYTVVSAKYIAAGNTLVDLTSSTTISNGKITVQDGANGSAVFDVAIVNPILSSSNRLAVGSYNLRAMNSVETSANFNNTILVQGIQTVTPRELVVNVTSSKTKTYNGDNNMPPLSLGLINTFSMDIINVNGQGQFDDANVGDKTYTISNIILSGNDAMNYFINGGATVNLRGTDGKIVQRKLEIVPNSGQFKTFGQQDSQLTYTYSGNIVGEIPGFSGQLNRTAGEIPGTYLIDSGNLSTVDSGGFISSNYILSFFNNVKFSIGKKDLNSIDITIDSLADLTYNGQAHLIVPVVKFAGVSLVNGIDYTLAYNNNRDAGIATITLVGIGNFSGTRTTSFTIKPKQLVVTPDTGLTKVYGEIDPLLTYTFTGNISGETPLFSGNLSRELGENSGLYKIIRGTLGIANNGSFKATNYLVSLGEVRSLTITKATLTVKVNDDSKFVTRADANGYSGLSFSGFKFGENTSNIDQTGLVITRTNAGAAAVELAQLYTGVLTASGLASGNYNFNYQPGNYTIVGADQLLVKITNVSPTYGANPTYSVASAQYVSSGNVLVDLTSSTTLSNGRVTVVDGSSGSAIFDITVLNPSLSSAGKLKAGTYLLGANIISETSANFNNTIVVQGLQTVLPKVVTASVTSSKTKVYDGTRQMPSLSLGLTGVETQDVVTTTGSALFDSATGGTQSYKVTDIILSGIDATNYFVTGGATAVIAAADGLISKRPLTISADNKSKYRGTTDPVFTVTTNGFIAGESISNLSGNLAFTRTAGEVVGTYAISATGLVSDNYDISFVPAVLTIETTNLAPTDITISSTSIAENNSIGSVIGALNTVDANVGDLHTYTLINGNGSTDNSMFTIVGSQLRSSIEFDFETKNSYNIRLKVTDAEGAYFEKEFIISITDVNENPTNLFLSANSINENTGANASIGSLSTTDVDSNNSFVYTLVNGTGDLDNAAFIIIGSDLKIVASPDFESKNSYSIRIRTSDQGGLFFEKQFTISINDLNEAPTNIVLTSNSINENSIANTTIAALTSTDSDVNNTFVYSLVNGVGDDDNALFSISGTDLKIVVSPNFDVKPTYEIRIRTTDQGGLSFEKVLTIMVNDVNEAPSDIALSSSTVNENVAVNSVVSVLSTTDVDTANTFTYTLVAGTGDTDNGSFNISGNSLRTTASLDFETKSSYSVRVRTTDQGGLSFEKVFTINVLDQVENLAPTDISLSNSSINETNAINAIVGALTTVDTDSGDTHAYTLVSGFGATDNASFTISDNQLIASVAFDFETKSSYSVRVKTTDQGGLSFEKVFTITVNDVNETPSDITLSATSVAENVATNTVIGAFISTDVDTANTFTYTLVAGTGDTDNGSFNISGNSLRTTASLDFETKSNYGVRVRTTDQGGLSFEKVFTITVNDANETPIISISPNSFQGIVNVPLTTINVVNSGEAATFTISPGLPSGLSINSTTGLITGTPSIAMANRQFTVTATNAAGTSTATFNLFIDADLDGDGIGDTTDPDVDGDGVPNSVEIQEGTNPTDLTDYKDTDGDGVPDYVEVQEGTNPNAPGDARDTDGDGVPDYVEILQGTNPNTPGDQLIDTDGDGVPDYVEVQEGTNPNFPGDARDTDSDGVPDYVEILQGTNPNTPGDQLIDTDGDGVPDYVESRQGTNPNVPGDARDTDGDGVPDYVEIRQGTNPNVPNILLVDTDGDGIPDSVDTDDDGDTILDINDAFPLDKNEWKDTDGDGIGDNADTDDDNDGILDVCDVDVNGDGIPDNGVDMDGDGIIDSCDTDRDGDGVNNTLDNCPDTPNRDQADRDRDGKGDVCDTTELNVSEGLTPNGDGINDTWVVYNLENHPGSIVRVFNANGKEVFYSNNYQNDWAGNYQGSSEMLPVGSYLYQIDLGGDGSIDVQGWLYITK